MLKPKTIETVKRGALEKEKKFKKNSGITIISLIITIALMLILVGVTVRVTLGENGIITKARKESFYQEMIDLEEKKQNSNKYSIIENADEVFINENVDEERVKALEKIFLDRNLTIGELEDLPNTLKAEIIYVRNDFGDKERLKTSQIWNYNVEGCKDAFTKEKNLEGLSEDIYYIKKEFTKDNKEEAYLYDSVSDTCYKIKKTKIGKWTVHSLAYGRFAIDGVEAVGEGVIETEVGILQASDGTNYIEPDLNNFTYSTEIIYYSQDLKTKTVPIKEYLEGGKQNQIVVEGVTYTFSDYSSTGTPIWANIKTTANGLTAYWVWLPRYAYKIDETTGEVDVIFVDTENKPLNPEIDGTALPTGYVLHEGFTQKDGLKGIWYGKYQASSKETGLEDFTDPKSPNLSNFKLEDLEIVYYTAGASASTTKKYSELQKDEKGNPPKTIEEGGKTYYWYDYPNGIWANVKTTSNELDAYWVWLPRYAYKIEYGVAKVIFVDTNNKPIDKEKYGESLPANYVLHEGFTQKDGLEGIWYGKYQASDVVEETTTGEVTE